MNDKNNTDEKTAEIKISSVTKLSGTLPIAHRQKKTNVNHKAIDTHVRHKMLESFQVRVHLLTSLRIYRQTRKKRRAAAVQAWIVANTAGRVVTDMESIYTKNCVAYKCRLPKKKERVKLTGAIVHNHAWR